VRGGKVRNVAGQDWIYPSESQCLECHTQAAGVALGPEIAQLNKDFTYPSTGRTANQLATLDHIVMFAAPLPGDPANLDRLADPSDAGAPLEARARAYLHTNCSQCHRPNGPTPSAMDLRYDTALSATNACDIDPENGALGIVGARLIAPGDAARSIVVERMNRRDINGMPPLGSNVVDADGVALVSAWIDSLSGCQ
jgi:mono/diheme cytochrome c family protein